MITKIRQLLRNMVYYITVDRKVQLAEKMLILMKKHKVQHFKVKDMEVIFQVSYTSEVDPYATAVPGAEEAILKTEQLTEEQKKQKIEELRKAEMDILLYSSKS